MNCPLPVHFELLTEGDIDHELYVAVDYELNAFEFIAIGVRQEVLDPRMIKDAFRAKFLGIYEQTRDYIEHTRGQSQYGGADTWSEFSWLCEEWLRPARERKRVPVIGVLFGVIFFIVGLIAGYFVRVMMHH